MGNEVSEVATSRATSLLGRRALLIGAACASTAATAAWFRPRRSNQQLGTSELSDLIPKQIGAWRYGNADGVVIARSEEAVPVEAYDQLVARSYEAAGLPTIMLLVAYGAVQGGTLQLHRPETCYPGQGFELSDFAAPDLAFTSASTIAARRFTAVRDDRVERLLYWTRVGEKFPRSTAELYSAVLQSVLRGTVPDGVLVRISTLTNNSPSADRAIESFVTSMLKGLSPPARRLLLG